MDCQALCIGLIIGGGTFLFLAIVLAAVCGVFLCVKCCKQRVDSSVGENVEVPFEHLHVHY